MFNIEKSAFRKGEYVGYADGCVFHIVRTNSTYGNWFASVSHGDNVAKYRNVPIFAHRLSDMSAKLSALAN